MDRAAPLLAVLVLLVVGLSLPAAGAVGDSPGPPTDAAQAETPSAGANESGGGAAPGAHFAGVVAVQEAEVESELEGRSFGIQVARANSNDSRATVVADEMTELTSRTRELRDRRQELDRARENGSITRARYRAEMAALATRSAAVERQLDRSQAASRGLPNDLLESKGVNAAEIERLRNDSRTAAGPDAAAIARSITGPAIGGGLAADDTSAGPFTTVPGRPGSPTGSNDTAIVPDPDDFDTPTVPHSPDLPDGGNGTDLPTPPDGTDLPTDGVGDVISTIVDGLDGGGGNESDSGSGAGTDSDADSDSSAGTSSGSDGDGSDGSDDDDLLPLG